MIGISAHSAFAAIFLILNAESAAVRFVVVVILLGGESVSNPRRCIKLRVISLLANLISSDAQKSTTLLLWYHWPMFNYYTASSNATGGFTWTEIESLRAHTQFVAVELNHTMDWIQFTELNRLGQCQCHRLDFKAGRTWLNQVDDSFHSYAPPSQNYDFEFLEKVCQKWLNYSSASSMQAKVLASAWRYQFTSAYI